MVSRSLYYALHTTYYSRMVKKLNKGVIVLDIIIVILAQVDGKKEVLYGV